MSSPPVIEGLFLEAGPPAPPANSPVLAANSPVLEANPPASPAHVPASKADSPAAANSPIPVLFVIPGQADGPRSSMIFARRQVETVRALGVRASVFFLRSRTSPWELLRELRRFRSMLRAQRPAVIHAHYGTVTALFAALGAGAVPLVITYRGSDLNPIPRSERGRAALGRWFSQLAALRASRIVCVSSQLRARLWWRRGLVTVLPSGVDPRVFRPEDRALARKRVGWNLEDRVVLFNAGVDPRNKRLDLAQAAVRAARGRLPALRLEVLTGRQDPRQIPALMNAADCLLVTSDAEGSPTVVQEALASNLPVVSVDVGDVAERLRGVANTRIAARDPHALAEALVGLVQEPLRSSGRLKIAEISAEYIARELCRLYGEAAAEPAWLQKPAWFQKPAWLHQPTWLHRPTWLHWTWFDGKAR